MVKANNNVYPLTFTTNVRSWHKAALRQSEDRYSAKQTVFRRDSETTRFAAPHGRIYGVSAWTISIPPLPDLLRQS